MVKRTWISLAVLALLSATLPACSDDADRGGGGGGGGGATDDEHRGDVGGGGIEQPAPLYQQ